MATMQLSKPSSKKREADTAFAENHQDLSWSLDEDIPTESQSGAQKQSNLVNELLKATQSNTRKLVNTLLDNTQKIFSSVENEVQPFQAAHQTEMCERLDQLEKYLQDSKQANKEPLAMSLRQMELQINQLDQLGQCNIETDPEQIKRLDCDLHIKRRQQHKVKTSQRGAQVAQKQMNQSTQDVQIRLDTKKFIKAHRDFFKAIQSSQARI